MCRNIRKLRRPQGRPTDAELRDAALQFVRKISGFRAPSHANQKVFEDAVSGVTDVARGLFRGLKTRKK